MTRFIPIIALAILSVLAQGIGRGTGLELSVAGDIVGTFGGASNNRLEPREAEIQLYAPIDHLFDGIASLAAHNEKGQYFFEIHQLTIGSSKLISRTRFHLGQYFLGIGRLNRFHRHDWPFISAPKVQTSFFHKEGIRDSGIEFGYLFPTDLYLDLTVGVTNGWVYGHAHDEGTKPHVPTHYAKLATYADLFSDGGMQMALNYLGRKDNNGERVTLVGFDLTAKWRRDKLLRFLLQSEIWYRIQSPRSTPSERAVGLYVYPQIGLTETFYAGLRVDGFSVLSKRDASENWIGNYDYALVPTLSYKASEFSTVRMAYNFLDSFGQGQPSQHIFEVQAVFILGAHPSHDF